MPRQPHSSDRPAPRGAACALWTGLTLALACLCLTGCASVTNPVAEGVPVRRLPPEVFGIPKTAERLLPLTLLRQKPPDVYRLETGDILGIYIEGVLGDRTQPPPVRLVEQSGVPPAIGYPIPVRESGTLSLPLVDPIPVAGLTVSEAEKAVRDAYTVKKEILRPGRERIIVTLMQPRTYHVLVVRQDAGSGQGQAPTTFGNFVGSTAEVLGPRKRGTGFNLELPAYENDVLNALTRTGGLPGLDAKNEIIIQRGYSQGNVDATMAMDMLQHCPEGSMTTADGSGPQTIRIPLRLPIGAPVPFRPEDIILKSGDIVFIQSRDAEVFYTGGLLLSGQYPLPRDYDLKVVQAISLVKGTLINGGQTTNNFTGSLQGAGIGLPNPSLVSIIRPLSNGGQVVIRVDLNKALQDQRENVIIRPDDTIILQNTMGEAIAGYFTSTFYHLNLTAIFRSGDLTTTTTANTP
jgi:protein involved in polysaccharide export with SLBB domain